MNSVDMRMTQEETNSPLCVPLAGDWGPSDGLSDLTGSVQIMDLPGP